MSYRPRNVPFWPQQRQREKAMRPFEGIRVIDVTHVLAGRFGLSARGASVPMSSKWDDPNDPDQSRSSGTDNKLNMRRWAPAS